MTSIQQTFESVGTSIKRIKYNMGMTTAGPTPEELKDYMNVSSPALFLYDKS